MEERSRTITAVVICMALITCILGVAIYADWLPTSFRTATLARKPDAGKFAETRNGQVRSFVKGNTCQELEFSNDRGIYVDGYFVPCAVETDASSQPLDKGGRIISIRDAFTAR